MSSIKEIQDAINKTELTLKFSNEVIKKNEKLLEKLAIELARARENNENIQDDADQQIIDQVQYMDEETFKFIKSTE